MQREPPVPTLKEIQQTTPWVWLNCTDHHCGHHVATTLAWAVIRFGPDTSLNVLRQNARCVMCGRRGAILQVPSWKNMSEGDSQFPVHNALQPPLEG
jgi:hypothetical protein